MQTDERRGGAGPLVIRSCPKCKYLRQPGDAAPDWQCPACGVALKKASQFGDLERNPSVAPRSAFSGHIGKRIAWGRWLIAVLLAIAAGAVYHLMSKRQHHGAAPAAEVPAPGPRAS
jgi:hypothetical protein